MKLRQTADKLSLVQLLETREAASLVLFNGISFVKSAQNPKLKNDKFWGYVPGRVTS